METAKEIVAASYRSKRSQKVPTHTVRQTTQHAPEISHPAYNVKHTTPIKLPATHAVDATNLAQARNRIRDQLCLLRLAHTKQNATHAFSATPKHDQAFLADVQKLLPLPHRTKGQISALTKTEIALNIVLGTKRPAQLQHACDMASKDLLSRACFPFLYDTDTLRSCLMDTELNWAPTVPDEAQILANDTLKVLMSHSAIPPVRKKSQTPTQISCSAHIGFARVGYQPN